MADSDSSKSPEKETCPENYKATMTMMVQTINELKAEVFGRRKPFSPPTHAVKDGTDDMNEEMNRILEDGEIGAFEQNTDLFAESEDEFLDEIANRENETDLKGPPVRERFETLTKNRRFKRMEESNLNQALNRSLIPQNVNLITPRVNTEIGQNLRPNTKTVDSKIQQVQNIVNKITGNVIKGVDELLNIRARTSDPSRKRDIQGEVERSIDNVHLLLHSNVELSMRRREIICSTFRNRKHRKLASDRIPLTEQLFGDDLNGSLKSIETAERMASQINNRYHPYRFDKYQGSRNRQPRAYKGTNSNSPYKDNRRGRHSGGKHAPAATASKPDVGESCDFINFEGGRLSKHVDQWKALTTDPFILDMITGLKIDFFEKPNGCDRPNIMNKNEEELIEEEISKLIGMKVISESIHEPGEIISPIFTRPKSDGSLRIILNLKKMNESVEKEHFKMESIETVLSMIKKDCYMASIDLKHAYYSLPIDKEYRKYLKFYWKNKLYCYNVLPNGLSCGPRCFTKLLKPVFANLRLKGHMSSSFIDDVYLQGNTYEECTQNVEETRKIFEELGFLVHKDKSEFEPKKEMTFLGFRLNSENMTIKVTDERAEKVQKSCEKLLIETSWTIRDLAKVIGQIISCFPGVEYGPLFYRQLENDKIWALRKNQMNFDSKMTKLSHKARQELEWWSHNIISSMKPINRSKPNIFIETDASLQGYGAKCGENCIGGRWNSEEKMQHINVLEMLAIFYALKAFDNMNRLNNCHIRISSDNTTAVAYINNMGGSKSKECNRMAKDIWLWCKERNIWLSVVFLPGIFNVDADRESRQFNDDMEWKLDSHIFERICQIFGRPDIDMFATRLNYQIKPFVSWKPDPECWAVDAFFVDWSDKFIYCFPPFSIIQRTLRKWEEDRANGILIVPIWPTAAWFPQLLRLLIQEPVELPHQKTLLKLVGTNLFHRLKHLRLAACHLSGDNSRHITFLKNLKTSFYGHGEIPLKNNMTLTSRDLKHFVLKGVLIPLKQL